MNDEESLIFSPKIKTCIVCGNPISEGMSFHANKPERFKYMNLGECAHAECYVDLCVEKSIEKYLESRNMK